jgi:hypothetical protein
MNNQDKEIRLDRQPDEERKSDFPLGDNEVKTTDSPAGTDRAGFTANENLDQTSSPTPEDSPDNATTEGIP